MKNSIIITPTPNLSHSLDFYEKLNFSSFSVQGKNFVADGDLIIEIADSKFARAGIKLFKESWKSEVEQLRNFTEVLENEEGFLLASFSGIWIYLVESGEGIALPKKNTSPTHLGTSAGISLEGISILRMNQIWKILGFNKMMGDENSGWMSIMNEDGLGISLMKANSCPHLFFNPSLTYFNGKKNLEIIQHLRKLGYTFTEEITHFNAEGIVDNVILRDPGGLGFFIFSD